MKRWLHDSLFKRLFVLMWAALVLSHLAAFAAVMLWQRPPLPATMPPRALPLPTLPSLPPTPGVPDTELMRPVPAPDADEADDADLPPLPRPRADGLPTPALLLDYGVRLLVIALAAWWGARWVTAPMRRLADAARQLGPALREDGSVPALDETGGTAEVREAAQVFNAMARQLQQQFRARTLLMAAVSHDVRTPLTRLRLRLERLEEDVPLARRCIADVREIDALVESALELVRSEQAQEPLRATDLLALAMAVADDRAEQGGAVRCEGEGATARVQPAALRRVLDNLLDNALRHGTQVLLSLRTEPGWVCLSVDDDGPGIPEERLQAALDPFVQLGADPRRHHRAGLGLGLYIAHDLVRRQGGQLTLVNRAGRGLRAEVRLPAA
ncbi:ATP-binding protein [Azohydromonas aeria]|uniref:ATP-binding protein n=1 Tax=Azohydromonas aeria TaxID=2590212 RepID=UPI0012FCF055|nr:ATP-binding protein [Azohydromonas aeria]